MHRFYPVFIALLLGIFQTTFGQLPQSIDEWNHWGKEQGWTFEISDRSILDMPFEHRSGVIVPKHWKDLAPFYAPQLNSDEELPTTWDWREHNGGTPVKHQGSCGSCWAFGTVAVMEALIKIKTGKEIQLSEQQLVSCRPSFGSCMGGFFALDFYRSHGAIYQQDFPYKGLWSGCKWLAPKHEKLKSWAYVGATNRQPTTEELKTALYKFGPVAVTMSASGPFHYYQKGLYNGCVNGGINHIVTLVGWNDADHSWIVKNSWGKNWGEDGYARMLYTDTRGNKCNGIGSSAVIAVLP